MGALLERFVDQLFANYEGDEGGGGSDGDEGGDEGDKGNDTPKKKSIFDILGEDGDDPDDVIAEYNPQAFAELTKEVRLLRQNNEVREAQDDFKDEYPDATEAESVEFVEAMYSRDTKKINQIISDVNKRKDEDKDKDKSTPVLNSGDSDDDDKKGRFSFNKARGSFIKAIRGE